MATSDDAGARRVELTAAGDLSLAPIEPTAVPELAGRIAAMQPWRTLGIAATRLAGALRDDDPRYRARAIEDRDGRIRGVVGVRGDWLYGPYLALLVVFPGGQRRGIGSAVLAWMEREAPASAGNLWVCASAFNADALAFYERHGFVRIGTLHGLVHDDHDEILLRKRLRRG